MKKYITYGFKMTDTSKIKTDLSTNVFNNKPSQALWGSDINARYGWKEWVKREWNWFQNRHDHSTVEDYLKDSFSWTMEAGTKVFPLKTEADIEKMQNAGYLEADGIFGNIDYQKMKEDGWDAFELCNTHLIGDYRINLNFWDCESIAVLNPEKVILLERDLDKKIEENDKSLNDPSHDKNSYLIPDPPMCIDDTILDDAADILGVIDQTKAFDEPELASGEGRENEIDEKTIK